MPRQPRGKRSTTPDGDIEVVSKNSNGDGSVYFEPASTSKAGKVRAGYWRASYRDADGKRRTVSGPTRVQAEARREVKLAEIAAMPAVGSRFSRDTTVADLTEWWLDSVARHQVKTSTFDSYKKFASYLADDIGTYRVVDVGAETLTRWQSKLLDKYAPYTVLNCRKVCRQAFTEAVKFGLIPANPFDLVKAPRARRVKAGRALSPADAKALITASQELRLGAAVTLLFCQGWRVSEVLGLAWEDLDLDAGTAQIRRGASYTSSVGMVLGSTKTSGAEGVHHLAPVSVAQLRKRRAQQQCERVAIGAEWREHVYDGASCPWCSPPPTVVSPTGRRSRRRSVEQPRSPASIPRGWRATAVGEPSSPRCTQMAASISRTLPATSAMPTRRPPPSTSAAFATARRTRPPKRPNSSTRQSDIGVGRNGCTRRDYGAAACDRNAGSFVT